jgi:protease-4
MKKNYLLFGCLVFLVLAGIAFFIGLHISAKKLNYVKPIQRNSWLLINPSGLVQDYSEIDYSFMGNVPSVNSMCLKIREAAFDKNIRGIIIKPVFLQIGMPGIEEIGAAIREFKQTGKPVLGHLEMQGQADYLLASFADTLAMEPAASAGLFFYGVQSNIMFFKNLLDKVGVKVNVIKSGKYKGAGETYSRSELSPETYTNIKEVLSDRYDLLIQFLAKQRKLSEEQVLYIFEQRPDYIISADYALKNGLIDKAQGWDEFLSQHHIKESQLTSIKSYSVKAPGSTMGNKIAVCYLQGAIAPRISSGMPEGINAEKVQDIIDAVKQDKNIRAIVLRINSPGGSALESEIIYRKIEELKTLVPVVVSMSGVAASGGYYISSPADYIVADPYTITGSIGVIQLLPDASVLSKKIGISSQNIAFGKYGGALNLMTPPSQELIASLQRNSENVYTEFKNRVAKYRRISPDSLENLAGGRIWSAQRALENRLIDQIGNLDTALMKAAELANIKSYKTETLPRKKLYWEFLFEQFRPGQLANLKLKINNLAELISDQLEDLFRPYSTLCLMPYELN